MACMGVKDNRHGPPLFGPGAHRVRGSGGCLVFDEYNLTTAPVWIDMDGVDIKQDAIDSDLP